LRGRLQLLSNFVGHTSLAVSVALNEALLVEGDSLLPLFVLVGTLLEHRYAVDRTVEPTEWTCLMRLFGWLLTRA